MPPFFLVSQKHIRNFLIALIIFGAISGCVTDPTPVAIPTQTLIAPTETPIPTPTQPTATPLNLPSAGDLMRTPVRPDSLPQPLLDTTTPIDETMLETFIVDLATDLAIASERIQLVQVRAVIWPNDHLGCVNQQQLTVAIPGFAYQLLVGDVVYNYHLTTVGDWVRCASTQRIHGEALIKVDAVAEELVLLAQRRVAQQLDLPVRRVQMVDVKPYTWTDTSLGCPAPEVRYTPTELNGYRIVLLAGENRYIFHTDSVSLFPCESDREILNDE